ncbi:MAG: tetratricopeptide repeat protein [Verrucomicrobiia bacterium]
MKSSRFLSFFLLSGFLFLSPLALRGQSDEEKSEVQVIQKIMDDGLFFYAEVKLKKFLANYPESEFQKQARLWLGQSQYSLGQFEQAIATLKPNVESKNQPWRETSLFYTASAYADNQQWDKAENFYRMLLAENSQARDETILGLAWVLLNQNKVTEGQELLKAVVEDKKNQPLAQLAKIVLAKDRIRRGDYEEAKFFLTELKEEKLSSKVKYEVELWLGKIAFTNKNFSQARHYFETIALDPQAFPKSVVAQAILGLGESLLSLGEADEALSLFEKNIVSANQEGNVLVATKYYIQAAKQLGNRGASALSHLQDLISKNLDKPFAAACLYAIGEAQIQEQQKEAAKITWNQIVDHFPETSWHSLALCRLGEMEWNGTNVENAVTLFQRAMETKTDSALVSEAQFRLGEVYFSNQKYAEAYTNFLAVLENAGAGPLKEKAVFNALLALSKQNRITEFNQLKSRFASLFPESLLQEQTIQEQAQLYARSGQGERARERWQLLLDNYPESESRARVMLAIGQSFYDEAKYQEAVDELTLVTRKFSEGDIFVSAEFLKLCALYQIDRKNADQILNQLQALLAQFPQASVSGSIQFKMGQIYFDKEDFPNAQIQFETMAKNYAKHDSADEALYFAGVSALRRANWVAAVDLFEELTRRYPNSARVLDARLGQGDALTSQAKFSSAMSIYDAIIQQFSDQPQVALAYLGRGLCLFRLAADAENEKRYTEALAAFNESLNQKKTKVEWRNEAGWRKGKTLEKLGRTQEALEAYLDVVYGRWTAIAQTNQASPPEYYWFGKAVIEAGTLLEQKQDWKGAIALYRVAEKQGGPEVGAWRDRRLKLQRDYFIYD